LFHVAEHRIERAMDDHLVDDDLGQQRNDEGEQLYRCTGKQDVAPHARVPQHFATEPAQAERLLAYGIIQSRVGWLHLPEEFQSMTGENFLELARRKRRIDRITRPAQHHVARAEADDLDESLRFDILDVSLDAFAGGLGGPCSGLHNHEAASVRSA